MFWSAASGDAGPYVRLGRELGVGWGGGAGGWSGGVVYGVAPTRLLPAALS